MMAEQLGLSQGEIRLVRLAALLHDLGHGPFSHVSENLLKRYANPAAIPDGHKKEKIHELITSRFIQTDEQIRRILGESTGQKLAQLLSAGHGQPVLRSLLSGPLDADKQDYLLRDSRFCGVQYGVFDIEQLHRSLTLFGPENEKELMIKRDGIHAVEQYVLAKYYLTTNVYRHRVRLITDQMLIRAIVLGIEEDDIEDLRKIYAFDNSRDFVEHYAAWDDSRVLHRFDADARPNTACGEILTRLQRRRLFKQVYSMRITAERTASPEVRERLATLGSPANDQLRRELEGQLAQILTKHTGQRIESRFVIVHGFDIESVRTASRNDEAGIMVVSGNTPRPFEQESALFNSINEGYAEVYLEVYAPVVWQTRTEREQLRSRLEGPIYECLQSISTTS